LIPAADTPVDAPAAKAQYVVREITGFVPLQVYKLGHRLEEIRKATNPFNAEVVLDCLGEFSKVIKEEIDGLLEVLFYGAKERGKLEQVVEWMSAAASGNHSFRNQGPDVRRGGGGLTEYVDWDFFYPEGETMIAKPISVLALHCCVNAIVRATGEIKAEERKERMSDLARAYSVDNPSGNEFIVEGLINSCLAVCNLTRMNVFGFPGWPTKLEEQNCQIFPGRQGHQLWGEGYPASLLVPKMRNFPRVDSVLVYQFQGICYIVGIQTTLQSPNDHAHSLNFLLAEHHGHFVPRAHQDNYRVALLWIVRNRYVAACPALPPNAIQGVGAVPQNAIAQGAVSLESFEEQSGVPIP